MTLLVSQSVSWGWLFVLQFWILLVWFGWSARARSPFVRRLDRLLLLLTSGAGASGRGGIRTLRRYRTLSRLRGSAWRWRVKLRAVYEQGYQATSETISPAGAVEHGRVLLGEAVQALRVGRTDGGARVSSREDRVVVLAYGLGAWPSGRDLTSLEQLLGQLGLSQGELRTRFEGAIPSVTPGDQSRAFRELAGASFVLGAASRIVEAAAPPVKSAPSPGWFAAFRGHRR